MRIKSKVVNLLLSCVVALALLVGMAPQAPAQAAPPAGSEKIDRALLDKVRANPKGKYSVIISMEAGKGKEAKAEVEKARKEVEDSHKKQGRTDADDSKIQRQLSIIGGASGSMRGEAILALSKNPKVRMVSADSPVKLLGAPVATISTLAVNAPAVWALGYTGRGVGVAVLDSGVAPHQDLTTPSNRVIGGVDLVGAGTGLTDLGGHGTHVAGIIAGNGSASDGARPGIAPEANIISVKVTDDSGSASISSVIHGVQWAVHNKRLYNIRVMNISLGATVSRSYKEDPLAAAIEVAWFSGIVVVAAAGNEGPAYGTISSPGNDPYAITVGALDDMETGSRADDTIAFFSSRGPTPIDNLIKPDLVAPGRRVVSLRSPGSFLDNLLPDRVVDNFYFRLSGTSMSAPVVSGIAALMLQKDPTLTPNQIKYILGRSAGSLAYDRNTAGAGSANALAAVTFAGRDIDNRGKRPSSNFARAIYRLAKGAPLVWRDPNYLGRSWKDYTWDNLTWDDYTWDNFYWEDVTWESLGWSDYTWEDFTWDDFTWDSASWDSSATLSSPLD